MKIFKRSIALVLGAVLLLALAACGSPAGTYPAKSIKVQGEKITPDQDRDYLILEADGTYELECGSLSGSFDYSGEYTIRGSSIVFMDAFEREVMSGTIKNGAITIEEADSNTELVFKR